MRQHPFLPLLLGIIFVLLVIVAVVLYYPLLTAPKPVVTEPPIIATSSSTELENLLRQASSATGSSTANPTSGQVGNSSPAAKALQQVLAKPPSDLKANPDDLSKVLK